MASPQDRHIGLFAATGIGVGGIVGGGILALAGTAFAVAGPGGALLAFLLNALISLVTALSFAELSSAFPRSGGPYVFARRVLTVGAAFGVGWLVWFASIVAAVLYALGFATFVLRAITTALPGAPAWLSQPAAATGLAVLTTVLGTALLSRTPGSGGNWVNVLKVLVFSVLILGGSFVCLRTMPPVTERLTPFMPFGMTGVVVAMGYTYFSLQGFDLIAAVAGEVKEPRRILPRSMLLSLAIALVVYMPLLILVPIVGIPEGSTFDEFIAAGADTVVARAAGNYLGPAGFWLVLIAGILSMLSALLANLFASSRIAQAMAGDRTLPAALDRVDTLRGTPVVALFATCAIVCASMIGVGDMASAGAASSLIFLLTFALAHALCILARMRQPDHAGFRMPGWPVLPAIGGLACAGLAIFQAAVVPSAGVITVAWLVLGAFCYLVFLGPRARIVDASSEASDPELLQLRGRSPLVLVPVANPENAATLALVAACLSPPRVGRVLLLNVVAPPRLDSSDEERDLSSMGKVLTQSMTTSLRAGVRVECLVTVAANPWVEIARVARTHRCDVTLIGMASLSDAGVCARVEEFAGELPGNVAILRAPTGWRPDDVRRVLIPIGGRGLNNALRARLLTALHQRTGELEVHYLVVVPPGTSEAQRRKLADVWLQLVREESEATPVVDIVESIDVGATLLTRTADMDLVLLGLNRVDRRRQVLGDVVRRVADGATCAAMIIGQRE